MKQEVVIWLEGLRPGGALDRNRSLPSHFVPLGGLMAEDDGQLPRKPATYGLQHGRLGLAERAGEVGEVDDRHGST